MAILQLRPSSSEHQATSYTLLSPVDMKPIYTLYCATDNEVEQALLVARQSTKEWASTTIKQRITLLRRLREVILQHQQQILDIVIAETGKAQQEAFMFEIYASCDFISYFCNIAERALSDETRRPHGILKLMKKLRVHYKPLGVVAVISPWNGPFVLCLNPCVQALLAGNTVVAKGSEVAPRSASIINQLAQQAGFPEGVLQVLEGDAQTGQALVNGNIDKLVFTGSTQTGKRIAVQCAERLIPYTLELGGNDAMIVCADANLDHAAHAALWGGCVNSGHFCCGTERIYVEDAVYQEFLTKLINQAQALRQGSEHGYEQDLGAIFWDRQFEIIDQHVTDAISRGASVHYGANPQDQSKGLYYPATILSDLDNDSRLFHEETFGPVLAVQKVASIDEAINRANHSEYGLHGSLWTQDLKKGIAIAKRIETGSVAINDIGMMYGVPVAPFAGVKNSGFGKAHNADQALRSFCHAQAIISGRYTGHDNGYPFSQKSYRQIQTISRIMWQSTIGRLFFDKS